MRTQRSWRITWLARLVLVVSSVALVIGLAEGAARLWAPAMPLAMVPSAHGCWQRDSLLGLSLRPNCEGRFVGVPFRTNQLGQRGAPLRDGPAVILALGDSCTFGWKVTDAQTYPAVLQALLDRQLGAGTYQVLNAGVPGYTSHQGLLYLRERGMALQPRVVIFAFGFNDGVRAGDIEISLARARSRLTLLDDTLLDWSRAYRWVRLRTASRRPPGLAPRVSAERYGANARGMIATAQAGGAQVLALSFWSNYDDHGEYRRALEAAARAAGVPVVTYAGPKLDVVHPTRDGYRELAEQIGDRLTADGMLR